MSKIYKTPDVYVEEISSFPPSIAQVETAIPAFVGYTEKAEKNGRSLLNQPTKVHSILDFRDNFGGDYIPKFLLVPKTPQDPSPIRIGNQDFSLQLNTNQRAYLFRAVSDFFSNGGKACYVVSVGTYGEKDQVPISKEGLLGITSSRNSSPKGLKALMDLRKPSILVIPDAVALGSQSTEVYQEMLKHCHDHGNRFSIFDLYNGFEDINQSQGCISEFRNGIGNSNLSLGAAYYPWLDRPENQLSLNFSNLDPKIKLSEILLEENAQEVLNSNLSNEKDLHLGLLNTSPTYKHILKAMGKILKPSPISGAIAGVYSRVDLTRGVWKAPANVALNGFEKPSVSFSTIQQEELNIDPSSGKSINSIRHFQGKGILVWGARTLAGNDNEWRYIPVKRTYLMVRESIHSSLTSFVFEPNDANTWARIRAMVENFLTNLWRDGAFQGIKPDQAFFVRMGLGQTMTSQDIIEGKGIIEIGMALVRPAEFILLKLNLAFQEA
ncbi:hypothetical protein DFQ04_2453 [Algoriphagus boseongensis]|uniref:Tail sheath protein C-terminal domain-containing protein n=1 Tax=Algoriphagus boseongensis TaxID=1442587 RepID=A0A4R6T2Z8_9BACT|nr:phage tail sheath C-terminal domain-containing protein [Algoriphagus boseongensis]TDQ16336.1 hypothetical protein DFQ04_2453 [Algoriphagus boseongensis]